MTFLLTLLAAPALAKPKPVGPVPDKRAVAASKGLGRKVRAEPEEVLPKVVERLVGGTDDPALKVRRIHDWIALNVDYDVKSYLAGERLPSDVASTLSRGSAVCAGYARLFDAMAALAGLESTTIHGYGRGFSFDPFDDQPSLEVNHAWNAVRIGDEQRLLDVTWDAGSLDGGRYRDEYSTQWLFPDPSVFAYTHLPTDPAMQQLPEPVDEATFRKLPNLEPPFGSTVTLADGTPGHSVVEGSATLTLRVDRDVRIEGYVRAADGEDVPGAALTDGDGETRRIRVRFPEAGDFVVHVGIGREGGGRFETIGQFAYTSAVAAEGGLAATYTNWRADYQWLEPEAFLRGTPQRVVVRLPGVEAAMLVVGDRAPEPMTREGDVFTSAPCDPADGTITVVIGTRASWVGLAVFPPPRN